MRQLGSQWPVEYGVTKAGGAGLVVRHQRHQRTGGRASRHFEFLIVWMEYCNPLLDETNKMDGYWKSQRGNHNWLELGVLGIFNCWEGGRKQTNQSDYNGQLPIQYIQYQMFE